MTAIATHELNRALSSAKNESRRLLELRQAMQGARAPKPKGESLCIFLRSLAMMISCGMRLNSALSILAKQSEDLTICQVAAGLNEEVSRGNPLSRGMHCFPNVFSRFQVSLVQVGEKTGTLERTLTQLADYEERSRLLTMRVKSALTYPVFVLIVSLILLIVAPPYLFSGILPVLKSGGVRLPLPTQIMIGISDTVRNPWLMLLISGLLFGLARLIVRVLKTPTGAYRFEEQLLSIPVIGKAVRTIAVTRFSRSMEVQLSVGSEITSAVAASVQSSQSPILAARMKAAIEDLRAGIVLSKSLERTNYFPPTFVSILKVAEETGNFSQMLERISHIYEMELDSTIDAVAAMAEPLIMLLMGIIVGFMLISIMLPLMQLVSNL
jgi:type II secretory pathway component PulF